MMKDVERLVRNGGVFFSGVRPQARALTLIDSSLLALKFQGIRHLAALTWHFFVVKFAYSTQSELKYSLSLSCECII